MNAFDMLMNISQEEKSSHLIRRVRRLENKLEGGREMSGIIKNLVGKVCSIDGDDVYIEKCTVEEADEEWIRIIEHQKKKDVTRILRIDMIEEIKLLDE